MVATMQDLESSLWFEPSSDQKAIIGPLREFLREEVAPGAMARDRDAYVVLQVLPEAPQDVIQAAYRALARRYHPDGLEPQLERMKELNLAYERVRTNERRAAYDAERRRRLVPVGPGRAAANGNVSAATESAATSATAGVASSRASGTSAPVRPPFGFRASSSRVANGSSRAADDFEVVDFGQYAGWRIAQIARHDPDSLRWLSRHSAGVRYLAASRRYLPDERDRGRRSYALGDW
jgi:curved DNA-binding protein CbpA